MSFSTASRSSNCQPANKHVINQHPTILRYRIPHTSCCCIRLSRAEFALLRLFAKEQAQRQGTPFSEGKPLVHAVYVAPLEALVAEKYAEWRDTLGKKLGIKVARLTGVLTQLHSLRRVFSRHRIVSKPGDSCCEFGEVLLTQAGGAWC
jgi:hypothetical protein